MRIRWFSRNYLARIKCDSHEMGQNLGPEDEYFFHQCVKVLFDFFKRFLNGNVWRKFLYTINTQSAWEVTLYCRVACVLGMVKFTISAQCRIFEPSISSALLLWFVEAFYFQAVMNDQFSCLDDIVNLLKSGNRLYISVMLSKTLLFLKVR